MILKHPFPSMSTSRIVELAKEIESNTTKLDRYLEENNLPRPSFDVDAPLMLPLPPDILAVREDLMSALDELYWLNQGPIETVIAKSVFKSSILFALSCKLMAPVRIFDWFESDSTVGYSQACPS